MTDFLKKQIMEFISDSLNKITRRSLENEFSKRYSIEKKKIKSAVKALVEANELIYTNIYGSTFLEKSFNKPVRISERIILKPPEINYQPEPDDVVINIRHGDAFGAGDHPTTRLALRGIEYVFLTGSSRDGSATRLYYNPLLSPVMVGSSSLSLEPTPTALDIGTGSGVLAIAAVQMGIVGTAIGTELDPCAIAESKENVRLNHLEARITICRPDDMASGGKEILRSGEKFSLILANLRSPTLRQLYPQITKMLHKGGYAVFSGIKADEVSDMLSLYTQKYFSCRWEKEEKDWAGLVLERNSVGSVL